MSLDTAAVIDDFRDKVCGEIALESAGLDRYVIHTPFQFDDGDHYVIVLRREGNAWLLTDEAHTFMHLSYGDVDVSQGGRGRLVDDALTTYGLERRSSELLITVPEGRFGDALFSMIQGLDRITSAALWTRDRVRSTFREDFRAMMEQTVPADRLSFDYNDATLDPDGLYTVDCRINGGERPWFLFAVPHDARCREATITIYHYEKCGYRFRSVAVFREQEEINRRALAMLTNVVDRQFASLGARDRITEYVRGTVLGEDR